MLDEKRIAPPLNSHQPWLKRQPDLAGSIISPSLIPTEQNLADPDLEFARREIEKHVDWYKTNRSGGLAGMDATDQKTYNKWFDALKYFISPLTEMQEHVRTDAQEVLRKLIPQQKIDSPDAKKLNAALNKVSGLTI